MTPIHMFAPMVDPVPPGPSAGVRMTATSRATASQRKWRAANPEKNREVQRRAERAFRRSPRGRYRTQKEHARDRGIQFLLTFDQWWEIWQLSGHWGQRGIGASQYCMCRYGDNGPYAVGNVFIATNSQNGSEANRKHPRHLARHQSGVRTSP